MPCIYVPAPEPENEAERLAALQEYRLIDKPASRYLDKLTRAAAHIFNTPFAILSLVNESQQVLKSKYGTTWRTRAVTFPSAHIRFCRTNPWRYPIR
jgi:hypothetical protein